MLCKQYFPRSNRLVPALIVLSLQLQEFTRPGAERHKLTFPILTDRNNRVGEACGLAFRLPDLIGHDGVVVSAEADPDYTHRPETEETLAVLRGL